MKKYYQGKKGSKTPKKLPKYLPKAEILSILDKAKNDNRRNYLILLTLWRTGLRVSELVNLRKRDIKDGNIFVMQGKGKKDRVIPLEKELDATWGFYLDGLSPKDRVFNMTDRNVRYIVKRYSDAHPHTFRHSFAVYTLKAGMNIRSLQKILGHENLETTAEYLDVIGKDVKTDFEKVEW